MGSGQSRIEPNAAHPMLNKRDYQEVKALIAREIEHADSDQLWRRIESLMQEVADSEVRFAYAQEEGAAGWVEHAYVNALEDIRGPRPRLTDADD